MWQSLTYCACNVQMCIRDRIGIGIGGINKIIEGTAGKDEIPGMIAVSYTHLDVYKRQGTECLR